MTQVGKSFKDVVEDEVSVINARRILLKRSPNSRHFNESVTREAAMKHQPDLVQIVQPHGRAHAFHPAKGQDERGMEVPHLKSEFEITGLALSGGGIRSAAFCLGVMQGMNIVVNDDPDAPHKAAAAPKRKEWLDAIDYLSTVSGGGYMGISVAVGQKQTQGHFPYDSLLDQQETIETQHIRNHAQYLTPRGLPDVFVGLVALLRGQMINAMIFFGIILALCALTVLVKPTVSSLARQGFDVSNGYVSGVFLWTSLIGGLFLLLQLGYVFLFQSQHPMLPHIFKPTNLQQREAAANWLWLPMGLCALVFWAEFQSYVLAALFEVSAARHAGALPKNAGIMVELIYRMNLGSGKSWSVFLTGAVAIVGFGNKLLAVAAGSLGASTWAGALKHWFSRLAIYLLGLLIPLLLWFTYLVVCYWGILDDTAAATSIVRFGPSWLAQPWWFGVPVWLAYALIAAVVLAISCFVTPNANSMHSYYRDRLSRAFLWQRDKLEAEARGEFVKAEITQKRADAKGGGVDNFTLSSLKSHDVDGAWYADVKYAPYLLINTAVNIEHSKYLNRRGRNADSFFFSPLYVGSAATGYAATIDLERIHPNMNIGTAMAISGAAASANMGASTIPVLTFSLAALNIRLGYWLPNPRYVNTCNPNSFQLNCGPLYFAKETFGLLTENTPNVYLTDGGHFDNLGLYELLRRRCKTLVVVDGEADPQMNFGALIRLQRYARIDLGVLIDLPLDELRDAAKQISLKTPHGPTGDANKCNGPHVAVGRITYSEDEIGILFYIKSVMSGDESDLVRDYQRRNTDFPHETTLDQFFSEEQFEVYRALGFHSANNFFSGKDRAAMIKSGINENWPDLLKKALTRLDIPPAYVTQIVERQRSALRDGRP